MLGCKIYFYVIVASFRVLVSLATAAVHTAQSMIDEKGGDTSIKDTCLLRMTGLTGSVSVSCVYCTLSMESVKSRYIGCASCVIKCLLTCTALRSTGMALPLPHQIDLREPYCTTVRADDPQCLMPTLVLTVKNYIALALLGVC
jgi:hypothetical protein